MKYQLHPKSTRIGAFERKLAYTTTLVSAVTIYLFIYNISSQKEDMNGFLTRSSVKTEEKNFEMTN